MAVARSENRYSAPTVTPEQSICRAWRLRGEAADLLSSWQERPRCPGPSRPLPVPGGGRIRAMSPRPVLRGLCCWILAPSRAATSPRSRRPSPSELLQEPRSPLHTAPLPLQETPLPRCSRGRSNLYTQSHCWSLSVLLPGQCMCPAALRELDALSCECRCLLVSHGPRGYPHPPGVLL